MKKISLKDIAKLAGVAPSTVSLVLNGKARQMRISDVLAERITKVASDAGYHPNQVAVSLRTGKSKILGLIVESISGNFFGSLAKIIEEEAEKFDYRVVYCSTDNNTRKGQELVRMLSQRQVDGYLITPTMGMEKDILDLVAHKRPVVLMDSYFPDIKVPYVLVNNYAGVREGMERLTSKGYQKIGYVTVDLPLIQINQRHLAYTETLQAGNIPDSNCLILKIAYKQQREIAVGQISRFIKESGLEAIFFATNYLGILGLESIQQLGLSIPGDIAVICFDDHDVFRLHPPGISVMRQPVEAIATTAVHLLMDQLGKTTNTNHNLQVLLPAKFIERGSIPLSVKGS
jgi:LacI family transcriptional regulator